ncbi:MAG: two-component sensor histidine kinase [Desulfobacteraceae bacterium]|nr:two-component sensor histidine kinase [Desulfobacteraceae bacterium]
MSWLRNLKPVFWEHDESSEGLFSLQFNFRGIWQKVVGLTTVVTLFPLVTMAVLDWGISQASMESEILLRTSRLVSNTRRSVSNFLSERKSAIDFVNHSDPYAALRDPRRLEKILSSLQKGFGGFVDLGVIDDQGIQIAYAGPHSLAGKQYQDADWFHEVCAKGIYLSDVFMGYRNIPHMVIAVRHSLPLGNFYVLRATVDMNRLNELLLNLEVAGEGDVFLINREGVLQTPSQNHGNVLERIDLPVPGYAEHSQVQEHMGKDGRNLIIGYAYINPQTSFILMIVKDKARLMEPWKKSRWKLAGFTIGSLMLIVIVILGGTTFLVNQIYLSDRRRLMAMHEVEYANKMASIGRLSAGVAHEINNPLAIINEKAGLIQDLFIIRKEYASDPKLMDLIDSILRSVERCAGITRRLLNFARNAEVKTTPLNIEEVIREVLGFMGKEAEYRSIEVRIETENGLPPVESDRGKLQEIFLNLITNAFSALDDGGKLVIEIGRNNEDQLAVAVKDNGCGIPPQELDRIFEPFYSTRTAKGGTGLGLAITYELTQELGGQLRVESRVGEGCTFTVLLPL